MKSLVKKNQLMITALAIMIAIAGYLQFAGTNLEEEYLMDEKGEVVDVADLTGVISDNYTQDGYTTEETTGETLLEELTDPVADAGNTLEQAGDMDVDILLEEDYLAEAVPDEGETPGEAVFTSSGGVAVLSEAKLLKEQTRARNKETLLEIIDSDGLTDVQKQEAVDSMVRMTEIAEKESAAEILLEAKGFSDVVVSIHQDAVDVVVNALELTDAQRAQIEDIVRRKTDVPAENIIISTVVE